MAITWDDELPQFTQLDALRAALNPSPGYNVPARFETGPNI